MAIKLSKLSLHPSWKDALESELSKPYISEIETILSDKLKKGEVFFPDTENIFHALSYFSVSDTKVVIIGQDPYHGPGQAHGLSFSVPEGIKIPPSLRNIHKELESDIESYQAPLDGCLVGWARQGVLLLNSVLTVDAGLAGSHGAVGWTRLTDKIIEQVNDRSSSCVFILWGGFARKKANMIDRSKHLVIESAHPSPLSSYRGFFGSKPFSKANAFLIEKGRSAISW